MKAQKIRITQAGWATYSGHLQGIKFTDGLSDDMVSPTIAMRIGSVLEIVGVDEQEQVGLAVNIVKNQKTKAEVLAERKADAKTEAPAAPATKTVVAKLTREELEAVADRDGIAGLRAIAEGYNVKGRGILELITEILKAQG